MRRDLHGIAGGETSPPTYYFFNVEIGNNIEVLYII
jgi:hypothetical protein